jgi:hypothetical protein
MKGKSVIHGRGYRKVGCKPTSFRAEHGTLQRMVREVAIGYRHFLESHGLPEFESDRFRYGREVEP